jgi:transmembrane sensor
MSYEFFSENDFVRDVYFRNWVLEPTPDICAFWENWLERHPSKQEAVENAKQMLLSMAFENQVLGDQEQRQMWENISTTAAVAGHPILISSPTQESPFSRWNNWRNMAAAVAGIMLLAYVIRLFQPLQEAEVVVRTNFGETKEIMLPDQSVVTLNANSQVSYAQHWSRERPREVELQGEAFFKVTKGVSGKGSAKFVVRTSQVRVEVLGTQFNVSDRGRGTEVVLQEGVVQLAINQQVNPDSRLTLQPGELVAVDGETRQTIKKKVNPEHYSSWVNQRLMLENTSLEEVAVVLEETFGLTVHFEESRQARQKLTGIIPTNDLQVLLLALSKASQLNIEQDGENLFFKTNQKPSKL